MNFRFILQRGSTRWWRKADSNPRSLSKGSAGKVEHLDEVDPFSGGTEGSNPSSSTDESGANRGVPQLAAARRRGSLPGVWELVADRDPARVFNLRPLARAGRNYPATVALIAIEATISAFGQTDTGERYG